MRQFSHKIEAFLYQITCWRCKKRKIWKGLSNLESRNNKIYLQPWCMPGRSQFMNVIIIIVFYRMTYLYCCSILILKKKNMSYYSHISISRKTVINYVMGVCKYISLCLKILKKKKEGRHPSYSRALIPICMTIK